MSDDAADWFDFGAKGGRFRIGFREDLLVASQAVEDRAQALEDALSVVPDTALRRLLRAAVIDALREAGREDE